MLGNVRLKVSDEIKTVEELVEYLKGKGMAVDDRVPDARPQIPTDRISDMSGPELGKLLAELTTYMGYVNSQLALEKAKLNQLNHSLAVVKSMLAKELASGTMSKDKKEAAIVESPRYKEIHQQILNQKNLVELVENAILAPVKKDYQMVSRLISIWEKEIEANARTHNVGNKRGKKVVRAPSIPGVGK